MQSLRGPTSGAPRHLRPDEESGGGYGLESGADEFGVLRQQRVVGHFS
jgi:hypothetical protein